MGVRADRTQVDALERDLGKAAAAAPATAAAVVTRSALAVKADARRRISGLSHAPAYPASIGFDPVRATASGTAASTVVGPDKSRRQGALGNLLEYGSVKNAPRPHLGPAGEAEAPRMAKALEDLATKAVER